MKQRGFYGVREIDNLKDMIKQSTELYKNKNAFLVKSSDGSHKGITYYKFKRDTEALGTALIELGLKDQFIAVLGENRYEWCVTYLSTVNGLGITVPLDKELPDNEIQNFLITSNAKALVFSGKFENKVKNAIKLVKSLKYLINMDSNEYEDNGVLSYKKLIERGNALLDDGDRSYIDTEIDNEKMSILLFTSGTTDNAKGVMLSHKNICFDIMSVCKTVKINSDDLSLSILPLHHTYECSLGFLAIMYNGGSIAFNEGLKHIGKNLKQVKPSILISVPLLLESMYKKIWEQAAKTKGLKTKLKIALAIGNLLNNVFKINIRRKLFKRIYENIGGNIRLILTGAAAINPKVSKGFREFGIPILQGYGLTECSPLVTGNRDNAYIDSSAGLPIPGVEVKISNPKEDGVGEVILKGDNVMLGYFNNKEATEGCIKDGWFYTGDLGYLDKKGFLYITGRSKNVIVTKNGKNIFPEEVESYINRHPFVLESMVWGKYEKASGETEVNVQIFPNLEAIKERLKVISVSKDDLIKVFSDVIKNANKEMPLYKRIKDFSIRDSEFIKTTTKKIKRHMEKVEK